MTLRPLIALLLLTMPCLADEGMWLFDHFPRDAVKQKYGIDVTPEFLDNLRLASVRIGGGAGAFVSSAGLLITNQHLVSSCLGDGLQDGFQAEGSDKERRCANLDVRVLTGQEEVTQQFPAPAKKGSSKESGQRAAVAERLQAGCAAPEWCQVVELFAGSRVLLYRYKKYTDVRLVFAPEQQLAFFGRERDSITYLRYGMDVAFARVYENGKPAVTPHFLKWSEAGLNEGEVVFTAGDPLTTVRQTTAAQLAFYRDTEMPLELTRLGRRIAALNEYAAKSEENARRAEPRRVLLLETYKSVAGKLIGLRDDRLVARKTAFDAKIRRAVEADPKLGPEAGKVWDQVAAAYRNWAPNERAYQVLESNAAPGSRLFQAARALVRGQAEEDGAEFDEPLEIAFLAQYLEELKSLGEHEKDIPVKAILAGRTAQAAAEAMVRSSSLRNPGARRRLAANRDAVADSEDGMIQLALMLEKPAERIRKKREEVLGTVVSAEAQIAQYRYRLFGDAEYPDATGTMRVAFGVLKGYADRASVSEPYAATFSGLYYRQSNAGPYLVPRRWVEAKPFLNAVTALDFVSTCDVGGGLAGGPTVNRAGELVGITFDGNLESLPASFLYTDEQARAVHVSVDGVAEALDKVYKADGLLKELGVAKTGEMNPKTAP